MSKNKRKYTPEFKQDAVNYYYSSGKSLSEVSKSLKIATSTLSQWIKNAEKNDGTINQRGSGNYSSDTDKEIAKLKRELRDSQDALEILKKAISILND